MKYIKIRIVVTVCGFAGVVAWAGDNVINSQPPETPDPTLFPSTEFQGSVFGETANGNVDSQPEHVVVHTTTTTTTVVLAPPVPTPSPTASPPITEVKPIHSRSQPAARVGSPKALAFKAAAPTLSDPTIKKTYSHRRIVTSDRLEHNAGGGGILLSYFFSRYMGVSLESDFLGGNPYDTAATANLIFRYPFEFGASPSGYGKDGKSTMTGPIWGVAPYVLMGGGAQWDGRCEGVGDVGGGLEFRFARHYGVFIEGRWIVHDARQNYAAESAGFIYSF